MKILITANSLYILIGFVYYYFRNSIPIELSNRTIISVYALSLLLALFSLVYLLLNYSELFKKRLKYLVTFLFALLFLHNFLWTIILFYMDPPYEDLMIKYPDPNDKNRMIIEQYRDFGALGSDYRTVEVREVMEGVRWVREVE